jgi:hypothetical protein
MPSCTSKEAKRRESAYYFPSKRLLRALVCSRFLFLRNDCSGSAIRVPFFCGFCKETEAQQLHPRAHTHALITTVTDLADASSADPFGTCGGRPHCAHPRGGRWILRSPRAAMRPRGPSVAASAGRGRWGLGPPAEFVVRSELAIA